MRNAERNGPKSGKEKIVNYENGFSQVPDSQWVGILAFFKITKNYDFGQSNKLRASVGFLDRQKDG
jgi:hypothetical protein